MLKGNVFANQIFENQIFALFQNTFLGGENGICNGYKNSMAVTYSGSEITIASGAVCIQGRFLEEDTSSTITASTDNSYCKLIIEIDLDKVNTDEDFKQGYYKIIKGSNDYPALTQNDIVNNVAGVYQYELARFKAGANGITDFADMRTFLDFDSLYSEIREHIQDIDDGSLFIPKSNIAIITGTLTMVEGKATSDTISYPTGFSFDNCVVLSFMGARPENISQRWSYGTYLMSKAYVAGAPEHLVRLGPDGIIVDILNPVDHTAGTGTFVYKVILLKIS